MDCGFAALVTDIAGHAYLIDAGWSLGPLPASTFEDPESGLLRRQLRPSDLLEGDRHWRRGTPAETIVSALYDRADTPEGPALIMRGDGFRRALEAFLGSPERAAMAHLADVPVGSMGRVPSVELRPDGSFRFHPDALSGPIVFSFLWDASDEDLQSFLEEEIVQASDIVG